MSKTGKIRVLWTTNIVLPTISDAIGVPATPFGGWLVQMLQGISHRSELEIGVAMLSSANKLTRVQRDGVIYYALPKSSFNRYDVRQSDCDEVLNEFKPHLLHAHGSEMAFTNRFFRTASAPRVLSLQGLLNGIAPYQLGRLPFRSLLNPLRPREMLVGFSLLVNERLRFRPRLKIERETIELAHYIIGRTDWDRAHSSSINPKAEYRHCGENLRPEFYGRTWSPDTCDRRSIFIGSSASPLKGVHIALRAMVLLKVRYPEIRANIAGPSPYSGSKMSLRRQIGYPVYLLSLIARMELQENVSFVGELAAEEMASRLCSSNVYLLPSLIENSPNTLCEAMLMGVPSVAACVGGVPSIAQDNKEALLYQSDDPVMLAFQIQRLFDDQPLCVELSAAARARAVRAHDFQNNADIVDSIYRAAVSNQL